MYEDGAPQQNMKVVAVILLQKPAESSPTLLWIKDEVEKKDCPYLKDTV